MSDILEGQIISKENQIQNSNEIESPLKSSHSDEIQKIPNSSDTNEKSPSDKNSSEKIKNKSKIDSFLEGGKKIYTKEKENITINDSKDEIQEQDKIYEKYENLFLQKKRLMKKSDIILKKKIIKKFAKNYLDKEAELGSDNEEHDEVVKKVYHSDSDEEKENDKNAKDIENLIDNEQNEDYVQNEKYFNDMIEKDDEEIMQVIEGPKKRITKEAPTKIMIDENGLSLKVRMERMNDMNLLREEEDINNQEYQFKNIENNLKELKKQYNEDENNEEVKEMIENNRNKLIKQIDLMTGQQQKRFKQHMDENKEILKNVIQNDDEESSKNKQNDNKMIIQGNGAAKLGNKKFRPFCGMGKLGNCKNSLLNHIKKGKTNSNSNK